MPLDYPIKRFFSIGPLFNFDVHEDIRLLSDASIEKDEVRKYCSVTDDNLLFAVPRWQSGAARMV